MTYTVHIEQDEDAQKPDTWQDDSRFIVTTSNRTFCLEREGYSVRGIANGRHEGLEKFPLYCYSHSGVRLSLSPFSCPWDSGQIGFVLVRKDEDNPRALAEGLVEEWNQYLSGDVWGYRIVDEDGNEADSCWGHYGREWCESQAAEALRAVIDREKRVEAKCNAMMHL